VRWDTKASEEIVGGGVLVRLPGRADFNTGKLFFVKNVCHSPELIWQGLILAVWLLGSTTVEQEGIEFKVGLTPGATVGITELAFSALWGG